MPGSAWCRRCRRWRSRWRSTSSRAAARAHARAGGRLLSRAFLGLVATALAYALWGALLRRYTTATVTPFALLVPFVGRCPRLAFGERFRALRLAGMALVLAGLAVIVLAPASRRSY